ncbi:MAG: hypothetical protein ACRCS6_05115 [Turicibacter sp.]
MNQSKIKINLEEIKSQSLVWSLSISNLTTFTEYVFFKGQMKLISIDFDGEFTWDDHHLRIVNLVDTELYLTYEVSIGHLGKHGHQGYLTTDFLTFSGEKVLLLPLDVVSASDEKLLQLVDQIEFDCTQIKLPTLWTGCVLQKPTWWDIYNLMKSCYVFGHFDTCLDDECDECVQFYFDPIYTAVDKFEIKEVITCLYTYYERLFQQRIPKLLLCFFRYGESGETILGGASRMIIGSSIDVKSLRDWQLLSHRLFHAFMDHVLPQSAFHLPPHVWLTEGLATYYENMALDSLSIEFKNRIGFSMTMSMNELYQRYLYFVIKDAPRLLMSPMQEPYLKSAGRLEFLHYTQAPLVVAFIHKLVGTPHSIMEWLLEHDEKSFSLQVLIEDLLGPDSDTFADNYLFGIAIIPLWDLLKSSTQKEDQLLINLNEFEGLLDSWFSLEDRFYVRDYLDMTNLVKVSEFGMNHKFHFSSSLVEEQIKNYCPLLYRLLMVHAVHLRICGVLRNEPRMRHFLLQNQYQINRWEEFIQNLA